MKETRAHLDYDAGECSQIKHLHASHNTTILLGRVHKASENWTGMNTLGTGFQKDVSTTLCGHRVN